MWEAIAANKLRSRLLLGLMGCLLVSIGIIFGAPQFPEQPMLGALVGAVAALIVWFLMTLAALYGGSRILLDSMKARPVGPVEARRLWNVVEEMTLAAGLPKAPEIYLIDSDTPNAFAVGRSPEKAKVAVTTGLLRRLNRDELQGVIAHEIAHIRNLDIRFMTMAAVVVGAITMMSDAFFRSMRHGRFRSSRRSSSKGRGQGQLIFWLIALVIAILAPLCAKLLYFACSRRREYLADATAARLTRYPAGLASALKKISKGVGYTFESSSRNRVVSALFTVNPMQRLSGDGLFSSHPSTERRIRILSEMGGAAGYADYESAYRKVSDKKKGCLGNRTLASESDSVTARKATPESKQDVIEQSREALDIVDRIAGLLLLTCLCGVRIKIPPDLKEEKVHCPRCGRMHNVTLAVAMAANRAEVADDRVQAAPTALPVEKEDERIYRRKTEGWESFQCRCGGPLQLSPAFQGDHLDCPRCHRTIQIQ